MRQLRFVRTAEDGVLVLETTDGGEQFALPRSATIVAAVRDAAGRAEAAPVSVPAPAAETQIGPREIQMRVRAGESAQELADSIGVGIERIMRFAAPVMDERVRIADESRRARARRSTTDGQLVIFGEAVDERFTAHGIVPTEVTWDSHRRDDGEWVVVASWAGGDGRHSAEWVFHRTSRSVTPLDDSAADLLSDRPIRPVTPSGETIERLSLAAAPPLRHGVVAFPPMPDAHTGPLPVLDNVFDQEAPADGPRELPPLTRSTPLAASRTLQPIDIGDAEMPAEFSILDDLGFEAPPLPLGITDPTTRPAAATPGKRLSSISNIGGGKREESDEERAARVKVPSWDDILLGVRRKQD
jgi:hypothetical protein